MERRGFCQGAARGRRQGRQASLSGFSLYLIHPHDAQRRAGGQGTRSTGCRSPPASRRGPVPPDTNRQLRDASRDGGEGGPSRDCRNARCAGGATGIVRARASFVTRPTTACTRGNSGPGPGRFNRPLSTASQVGPHPRSNATPQKKPLISGRHPDMKTPNAVRSILLESPTRR
jgi:hypothetical protein